ncbi:MAG: hypothetical protein QQN62_07980 [Nitrosopumilus sp.]
MNSGGARKNQNNCSGPEGITQNNCQININSEAIAKNNPVFSQYGNFFIILILNLS